MISLAAHIAGELFAVEKVKPDPLNLLVNTSVGSDISSVINRASKCRKPCFCEIIRLERI